MNDLEDIARVLEQARKIIISGHVMPDGDCIGSVAAMGLALQKTGKEVTMAMPEPVPELFTFLPGVESFLVGEQALAEHYDLFLVLDCSTPERIGPLQQLLTRFITVCNIDHHAGFSNFAHYNYIDPSRAATAEIVQDLLSLMHIQISPEIATCLYTALVMDTGSFQYENTTPDTHRRAANLIEQGAPSVLINIHLHEQKPLVHFRILQAALNTLTVSPCGRIAWMSITADMLKRLQARDEHTEGLINYVRSIRGVEVALLFREISPGRYKVSLRSKEKVDVNSLARQFGGGGHLRAAGCIIDGDLELLKSNLVEKALQMVKET